MVFEMPMQLPTPSMVPTIPSKFLYHHASRQSESLGPLVSMQDPRTASPFGIPNDYRPQSSRGGTLFDSFDSLGSFTHGHLVPAGGVIITFLRTPSFGRTSGVNRYGTNANALPHRSDQWFSGPSDPFHHGSSNAKLVTLQMEIRVLWYVFVLIR